MGQNNSSPYDNSPEIQKVLVNGTWPQLERHTVRMDDDSYDNPFQHKYIVKLNSKIPANCNMTVIFPNHPVERKRLLWVMHWSMNSLSAEINKRIQESSRDGPMLAITMGDKIISFKGFVGNVYLVWAERVSQQTINRQENIIGENVPILIETNGQMRYRSVFIFDPNSRYLNLTPIKDISWFDPFQCELFCCETDARKEQHRIVPTVSNAYADQVTRDPVIRSLVTLDEDHPPFSEVEEELTMGVDSARLVEYSVHGNPKEPDESTK